MQGRQLAAAGLAAFLIVAPPTPGHALFGAGDIVFDPENYAQNLLTAARTLEMINNQVRSLQNEAQMLINMAKHLEQLDVSSLDALTQSIRQINQMMAEVRGIAFEVGAVERAFAELYPKLYDATVTSDRLAEDARTRFEHSVDAFEHTMRVQGQVVENVTSDVTEMASLVTASERAVGLLQAVQANNQLLALQTKQLVQVQDLMASQYRAESLELARSAAAEARASEQRRRFLGDGRAYSPAPVTAFRE